MRDKVAVGLIELLVDISFEPVAVEQQTWFVKM